MCRTLKDLCWSAAPDTRNCTQLESHGSDTGEHAQPEDIFRIEDAGVECCACEEDGRASRQIWRHTCSITNFAPL